VTSTTTNQFETRKYSLPANRYRAHEKMSRAACMRGSILKQIVWAIGRREVLMQKMDEELWLVVVDIYAPDLFWVSHP
jgi:hypothetical protein